MANLFFVSLGKSQKPLEKDAGEKTIVWLDKMRNSNGSLSTSKIRLDMQRVMQNNAAVFRTQETLEEGKLYQHIHYVSNSIFYQTFILVYWSTATYILFLMMFDKINLANFATVGILQGVL